MDKDRNLTFEEAKKLILKYKNQVHTFYNAPFGLIGADHSYNGILEDMKEAFRLNLAGESAQKMGHALAIIPKEECNQSNILFVETKEKEVIKLLEENTSTKEVKK